MTKRTTMFRLTTPNGTINTAVFSAFDDDPEKGRKMASDYITRAKERWGAQPMFAGETLTIVEE